MVTTRDAGGPLEVVADEQTGLLCEPEPAAVAGAFVRLASSHDEARAWGVRGRAGGASVLGHCRRPPARLVRVAYFSPLPPERTGIADYSALLLPELSSRLDVDVVRRGRRRAPRGTDIAIYHVGNNPEAHGWIVAALRRRRGIVVLHDFVLHHLVAGLTVARRDTDGYLDAMQRDSGVMGRLVAHGVVDGVLPPVWESRAAEFPLVREVLDHADGVIVHSRFVEDRVQESRYRGPVWRIPMPAFPEPQDVRPLGLPRPASVVIGSSATSIPRSGFRSSCRRSVPSVSGIRKRCSSSQEVSRALTIFELQAAEHDLRLGESVVHLGYIGDVDIWPLLAACDVLVSLRWPTMGETSGSVIRALSAGRPLIVSDVGWFFELPDSVAAKVPVGVGEVETLAAYLEVLVADEELRRRMGSAATAYSQREHDLGRVVDLYVAALEEGAGGPAVRDEVAGELACAAWDVGLDARSPDLAEIAANARELGVGL